MAEFSLVFPFLTDNEDFCLGVEIGMLYEQMKNSDDPRDFDGTYHVKNQDQIFLMANRLGWKVDKFGEPENEWFYCSFKRI